LRAKRRSIGQEIELLSPGQPLLALRAAFQRLSNARAEATRQLFQESERLLTQNGLEALLPRRLDDQLCVPCRHEKILTAYWLDSNKLLQNIWLRWKCFVNYCCKELNIVNFSNELDQPPWQADTRFAPPRGTHADSPGRAPGRLGQLSKPGRARPASHQREPPDPARAVHGSRPQELRRRREPEAGHGPHGGVRRSGLRGQGPLGSRNPRVRGGQSRDRPRRAPSP